MTQRERLVVELLRNMRHADEGAGLSGVRGSDSSRLPLAPHEKGCRWMSQGDTCNCWLRSVTELKRCLRELYKAERRLFWQVYERYIVCDRRPRTVIVKGGKRRIEHFDGDCFEVLTLLPRGNGVTRALVETWRGDVQPDLVTAGVVWIADNFRGSPQLPSEWRVEEAA